MSSRSIARASTEIGPPFAALGLVLLAASCAAVEWRLGILGDQPRLSGLLAASRPALLHGEVQRLFTASFFHLSLTHFVANSAGLLFVGGYLELRVGTPRFTVIALASAAGSILGSVLVQYVPWVAGASGLNYGLYGALAALIVRYWNAWDFDYSVPRWLAIAGLIALLGVSHVVALRALPPFAIIDHANHASGFLVGALVTFAITRGCPARDLRHPNRRIDRIAIGALALFALAFAVQAWLLWVATRSG
jgi:membrane associated rhomboid family serine protease